MAVWTLCIAEPSYVSLAGLIVFLFAQFSMYDQFSLILPTVLTALQKHSQYSSADLGHHLLVPFPSRTTLSWPHLPFSSFSGSHPGQWE